MATPLQKRKLMGEINVVPYIDVMLVLLVIFMVTAPLLTQGVKVELPKAGAEPIPDVPDHMPLIVSVDAEGNLYINTAAPFFQLVTVEASPIGSQLIGPNGSSTFYQIPAGLQGFSFLLQAFPLSANALNGVFGISEAHELQFN